MESMDGWTQEVRGLRRKEARRAGESGGEGWPRLLAFPESHFLSLALSPINTDFRH